MRSKNEVDPAVFGQSIEHRIIDELKAVPIDGFANLLDLKNLKGESTGYVKAFTADRVVKAASLSIDMMPGLRYFNIHAIPSAEIDAPRFSFEGMISAKASQVSMDLYPDQDMGLNYRALDRQYAGVADVYSRARADTSLVFETSRLAHMRVLCSPYFLLTNAAREDQLRDLEGYANEYFDQWLHMLNDARTLAPDEAATRRARRKATMQLIIDYDPDRDKVVQVYGEKITSDIEAASMFE